MGEPEKYSNRVIEMMMVRILAIVWVLIVLSAGSRVLAQRPAVIDSLNIVLDQDSIIYKIETYLGDSLQETSFFGPQGKLLGISAAPNFQVGAQKQLYQLRKSIENAIIIPNAPDGSYPDSVSVTIAVLIDEKGETFFPRILKSSYAVYVDQKRYAREEKTTLNPASKNGDGTMNDFVFVTNFYSIKPIQRQIPDKYRKRRRLFRRGGRNY
jgi:hypothetical protein